MKKLCMNCRNLFETARNVPHQAYCPDTSCQKARKIAWMKQKLGSDLDYKTNQRRAQKSWQQANPDYWKRYRERVSNLPSTPPEKRKLRQQNQNNESQEPICQPSLNGLFELRIISQKRRVKIDVYIVELKQHKGLKESSKNAKR